MNALRRCLAAILLTALGFTPIYAQSFQWERLAGPEGGSVRSIARTPDGTLFAAVDAQGVYKSNDGGVSWERTPLSVTAQWAAKIHATRTGTLLLATPDSLLLRSTDRGGTWTTSMSGLIYWSTELANDSSGGIISAGLHDLFRSTDDGASWYKLGPRIDDEVSALAVGPDGRLFAAVERSFSPRSVRYSTDLGTTWTQVQLGDSNTPTIMSLATTPDGRVYAGTGGGGMFRSDDGGTTWKAISIQSNFYYTAFVVPADGSIAVATSNGVYRSSDRGSSWQPIGNPDVRQTLAALALAPDGRVMVGTYGSGVYVADGNRWIPSSLGLPRVGAGALAISPDRTIYTVTTQGRFFRSSDGGTSWGEPDYSRYFPSVIAVDASGATYAVNSNSQGYGVIHSTDRGASWSLPTTGMEDEIVLAIAPGRHGEIYAAVERSSNSFHHSATDGLFRSTDKGANWTTLGTGLTELSPQSILELSDGTLFIGSQYGNPVMRLVPGETLWQRMSNGLPFADYRSPLYALIADRSEILYAGTQRGLFRSTNRGGSWQHIGTDIPDTTIIALVAPPGGRVFAATFNHGVYYSDDQGTSWHYLGDAPGENQFTLLAVDSTGVLYAGSSLSGLYRASISSSVPSAGASTGSTLAIHPNPVATIATVEFTMAAAGDARLAIYSTDGRQIGLISHGFMTQGAHRMEIDLSGYAAGSYRIQLETERGNEQIGAIVVR